MVWKVLRNLYSYLATNDLISMRFQGKAEGVLEVFWKRGGKIRKFCWKTFVSESPFKKVAGFAPATLLKKRHGHRCFPVNSLKYLRTPFLYNTSRRLFLGKKYFTSLFKKSVSLSAIGNSAN